MQSLLPYFATLYAIHATYSANTINSGLNDRHVTVSDDLRGIGRTTDGAACDGAAESDGSAGVGRRAEKMWVER